jgi:periplasmic protein TonB
MAAETISQTRRSIVNSADPMGGGFAGAFALHGLAAALLVGGAYLFHTSGHSWGDATSAGSIQATMVSAVPLPQKQPMNTDNVLATETPSPAPLPPVEHTVEAPKSDAIPIPVKPTKPVKVADKTTPPPPLHPVPMKPQPDKATTGDAPGVRIAMSVNQTRVGTSSVGVTDAGFGVRFAYYTAQIRQKVEANYYVGMLDPQAPGHRVYITFQIQRDGTPTSVQIAQPSGDATLDQTALRAIQHVDTFGPLPDGYTGSHVNVTYYFDPPPRP